MLATSTGKRNLVEDRRVRLKAELNRIRVTLGKDPGIAQVLVFGSMASGQIHEWSDLDVLVVKETQASFCDRSLELASVVKPQVGVQFVVYTPAEWQALAARPFVQVELMQKGKVLPMNPELDARRWLEFAKEDLRMAELALEANIFNQTCFHAQQCVEKCLKASLSAQGELLPRTHLIVDLINQLPESMRATFGELAERLMKMDQFYIPTRYPDALPGTLPEGLPQRHHADDALETARLCYDMLVRMMK